MSFGSLLFLVRSSPFLIKATPSVRFWFSKAPSKHFDPKFRKNRTKLVLKIDLPNVEDYRKEKKLSFQERRDFMKKEGIPLNVTFNYLPINFSCTSEIMSPFVPPEGDGKSSFLSKERFNEQFKTLTSKGSSWRHIKKIRNFEEDFDTLMFAVTAQKIFIEAHEALVNRDDEKCHELITENCYPGMVHSFRFKSVRWKWVEALEPPVVVHIKTGEIMSKSSIFAQVTVRLHSKQVIAIYDRFGRLMMGSPTLEQDVLEYPVFEKQLTNPYSQWRLHGKIIPDWLRARAQPLERTFVLPPLEQVDTALLAEDDPKKKVKVLEDE